MRRSPERRPVLITDAEKSPADQLRERQIRYALMMGLRLVCLIVGAVLVAAQVPLLWLWLPMCVVGMIALPWMAVIIANDRPPRQEHRFAGFRRRRHGASDPAPPQALPSAGKVIDQD